ncbi:MAG: AAA family ATPase [Deltaproteobacteria bacterium]|jgi:exonuclease SbcC|nr:AAA family ATPase [Deltaproteobacteria bacterium]
MRFLKLRMRNLNSLVGGWEIDFTDPAYVSDRLFLISGPTGSGKTTILDAICLALYAETPRLGGINPNSEPIMSRGRWDCQSELWLETQKGRYLFRYEQKRARRDPNGAVTVFRAIVELADSGEGTIVSTEKSKISKIAAELTGLTFSQFTKSALLAQNGFSAFLAAKEEEQDRILERLTDSAIYSELSQRAHQKAKAEKDKLDLLTRELATLRVLSPEETETLEARERELALEESARAAELQEIARQRAWLAQIATLRRELAEWNSLLEAWARESQDFAPALARLERAARAQELEAPASGYFRLLEDERSLAASLALYRESLPRLAAELAAREKEGEEKSRERELALADEAQKLPLFAATRQLDGQIMAQEALARARAAARAEIALRQESLERESAAQSLLQRDNGSALAENARELADRRQDESLLTEYAGLNRLVQETEEIRALQGPGALARASAAEELSRARAARLLQEEARDRAAAEGELLSQNLQNAEAELAALVRAGGDAEETRAAAARAAATQSALAALSELARQREDAEKKRAAAEGRAREAQREREANLALLRDAREKEALHEKNAELLEANRALAQKVASLAQERSRLRPGLPCPLCGALEHPYAAVAPAVPGPQDGEEIALAKRELKKGRELIEKLARLDASLASAETLSRAEAGRLAEELAALLPRLWEQSELWGAPAPTDPLFGEALARARAEAQREEEALGRRLELLALREGETRRLVAAETALKAKRALADAELLKSLHLEENLTRDLERLEAEGRELSLKAGAKEAGLLAFLAPFYLGESSLADLPALLRELGARRDKYQSLREARVAAEKLAAELAASLAGLESQRAATARELAAREAETRESADALAALREKRRSIFGDLDPEREALRARAALEALSQALEALQKESADLARRHAGEKSLAEDLQKRLAALESARPQQEARFQELIARAGFADAADLKAAALPAEEREELRRRRDALQEKETALRSVAVAKARALAREEALALTEASPESLSARAGDGESRLKALREEAGALAEKKRENARRALSQRETLAQADRQRERHARLERLNALIGSSGGKVFSAYAQSLTFKRLLARANQQLQKISGRYTLRREPKDKKETEFAVVDHYQGGAVRSARSLSGGETFIASLALALGLASLASEKVKVETLFLDEGFGTLDEEALDVALSALGELRSRDKTIGLISHVQAIGERISAQIRVTPIRDGRSALSGPGCRALP